MAVTTNALVAFPVGVQAHLPSTAAGIAAALNINVAYVIAGMSFFCTDTGNLFVWNGNAMVQVNAAGQSTAFEANGSALSSSSMINFEGDGTYLAASNPSAGNVKFALNYAALVTALETSLDTTFDPYGAAASALGTAESFATAAVATETSRAEAAEALLAPLASPTFTGTVQGITAAMVGADASGAAATAQSNAETYANSVNTSGSSGSCTGNAATATTAVNLSGSQTANYFYAAPNGSSGTGSWRAIVAADIPTLNQNTTGTAANLSGTPALPNGTTASTQTALSADTKIATDAYCDSAVGVEKTRALAAEALLAPLVSPALTGTPTAPTQAVGTNNTDIATTAYADELTPSQTTSGQGGFIGPGLDIWGGWQGVATDTTLTNYTANRVNCVQFYLNRRVTINHISAYVSTSAGTTATANWGIYNAAGTTKLFDSGPINVDVSSGTTVTQNSANFVTPNATPLVLEPGTYWYAFACTVSSTVAFLSLPSEGTVQLTILNAVATRIGMTGSSQALSAGVLPSSISTVWACIGFSKPSSNSRDLRR